MSKICVVGSINMDIVTSVDVYPERGQTVFGKKIMEFPGGKGANQSIACARQNKEVTLIGCVGEDVHGNTLINDLRNNQVDTSNIKRLADASSGQTTIILDDEAENTIIYVEGANGELAPAYVAECIQRLDAKILLTQMESPYETVLMAMKTAKDKGIKVILDPAPANQVTNEMIQLADIVLPNIHETELLTGVLIKDKQSAQKAANIFRSKGVEQGVLKLGSSGSYIFDGDELVFVEGIKVKAVDTVGAGDCFAGALASALIDGKSIVEAAKYANIVAALKVTKHGAQAGIPTMEEVHAFCKQNNLSIYFQNN